MARVRTGQSVDLVRSRTSIRTNYQLLAIRLMALFTLTEGTVYVAVGTTSLIGVWIVVL